MPSASTITLADGQATPVNHDFAPLSVTPRNVTLVNRDATTSGGQMKLIAEFDPAKPSRKTDRVKFRFNMPVEATDSDTGRTYVAYTARFSCDVVLPEEMTASERDDMAAFIKNAVSDTVLNGYISDLDPMY